MEILTDLEVDRIATGGAGIAKGPDGRVVFVDGALPGDRVRAEVTRERRQFLEARVVEILRPSSGRVDVACVHVAAGCGGCDWQHASSATQSELRSAIVTDALRRGAKINNADVRRGLTLPAAGYRTSVRAAVTDGRAGFRMRSSHEVVVPTTCQVSHPLVEEILVDGRFPGADEVSISVGSRTGERMVVVSPGAVHVSVPDDVLVVGQDELDNGRPAFIHEEVGDFRFRISAGSFFQCRPDGAEVLVSTVDNAVTRTDGPMLDAYAGVGLFGALLGGDRPLTAIESNPSSVADARVNIPAATIIESQVEKWQPSAMSTVIADPARSGLDRKGVNTLVATGAAELVLVSCDPASLGRDAGLLAAAGYQLDHVTVVDLFGQTSHVEAVSLFVRG